MSFYRDRVWPRLLDVAMSPKRTGKTRARVCAGLAGDVVEIGFGTGHNLTYLPADRGVDASGRGVRAGRAGSKELFCTRCPQPISVSTI